MYIYKMKDSSQLYKGTLVTIVLQLLNEQEKMYGYEICKKVADNSKGVIKLTEGALYPTLHKLEADGILTCKIENISNRQRKYYSITSKGKSSYKIKLVEFNLFVENMQTVLNLKPSV